MNNQPIYKVTITTTFLNGDAPEQHFRYFYSMKQAVADAEYVTGVEEYNGTFDSGWQDNHLKAAFFAGDTEMADKLRIIAEITKITMAEVPSLA